MSEKTRWETFFDAHAPVYDENAFTKNTIQEVDFLLEELALAPSCSILDVGCGTGRHSIELAKRGYAVTGLDLSSEMLARAASAAKNAEVHGSGYIQMPPGSHSPEGLTLQSVCAKELSDSLAHGMTRLINRCPSCATFPEA